MNLRPLIEIGDTEEFWPGTRIRLYRVGLNVQNEEDDFYEYMLIHDNQTHFIAANVSDKAGRYKAGNVICHVKILENVGRIVATGKALKHSFGTDNTFLVEGLIYGE